MEISKKELKKIIRNFRSKASRVLNANYQEVTSIIKMLVDYINETELIYDYIMSVTKKEYHIKEDVEGIFASYGRKILNTGSNVEEEVNYTYQLLNYICKNDIRVYPLGWGYTSSNKYQDMVKEFGEKIILPFANHIDSYMMDIATDMGYDDEGGKFMINVNGGQAQVNIANESATINATQNNQVNSNEIEEVIQSIKSLLTDDIDKELRELIKENSQLILDEVNNKESKPKIIKVMYKALKMGVKSVPKATALVECVNKLGELIQPFLLS